MNTWNTIVAANDISETLAFNANIPGISSSSRFSFSAQAYNVDMGRVEVDLDLNAKVESVDDSITPFSMPWIPLLLLNDGGPKVNRWTKLLGTSDYDDASGIAVDTNGNAYITGYTWGDLDGNTNTGDWDIFIWKVADFGM